MGGILTLAAAILVGGLEWTVVQGPAPAVRDGALVFDAAEKTVLEPAERPAFPFAVTCEVEGKNLLVETAGLQENFCRHWAEDASGVLRAAYVEYRGQSAATGGGVYGQKTPLVVEIRHFREHSSVTVVEKPTGRLLQYAPFVARTGRENPVRLRLTASRTDAAIPLVVRNLSVDTSLADEPAVPPAPQPPAGHRVVFSDSFMGVTEKWGAKTTCPGVLTIAKKTYFNYSYPILVPDLVVSDGIVAYTVLMEDETSGEVRFRVGDQADDYYTFAFSGGKAGCGFAVKRDGQDAKRIGTRGSVRSRGKVRFEVSFHGERLEAFANGELVAAARDASYASGQVFLCGSTVAATRLTAFDVFAAEAAERVYTDAAGRDHRYHVDSGFLWYDGEPFIPLVDSDEQYFLRYEPAKCPDARAWNRLRDHSALADIAAHGLTWQGVFLKLVDYIDPALRDHAFHEDGGLGGASRLLEIDGDIFRVTSPRKALLPYFSYTTSAEVPHKMHVVAVLVPNDVERYLGVYPLPSESGAFGVATGRTFPCDHTNRATYACYYPRDAKTEWIFLSNVFQRDVKRHMTWSDRSGGAIGGLWMMEPIGRETDYLPRVTPPVSGSERILGDYNQTPNFIFRNFGVAAGRDDKTPQGRNGRRAAIAGWLDHARFAGLNHAEVCWLGVDWLVHDGQNNVGYDTRLFADYRAAYDYPSEFVPELAKRGMTTFVSSATFNVRDPFKAKLGLSESDVLVRPDGSRGQKFGTGLLESASPNVQAAYCRVVDELARSAKGCPNVKGVAISIDGFFMLNGGWGEVALAAFERQTGIRIPNHTATNAYEFIQRDPSRLAAWKTWRAANAHGLLTRLRDTVRAVDPNWTLLVRNLHAYTYQFIRAYEKDPRQTMLDVGFRPELYADMEGLLFASRAQYENKITKLPGEWGFAYTHGVTDLPTRGGTGYHQWTGYWESPGMFPTFSKYKIGWLGCPNTIPVGRQMLETFTSHLANENIRYMAYQAWESAIEETEHLLRRMAAAYRALPIAEPRPFAGKVEGWPGLRVAWYGDRLAVINPTARAGRVRVPSGRALVEYGRHRPYRPEDGAVEVDVKPFDLLVFGGLSK